MATLFNIFKDSLTRAVDNPSLKIENPKIPQFQNSENSKGYGYLYTVHNCTLNQRDCSLLTYRNTKLLPSLRKSVMVRHNSVVSCLYFKEASYQGYDVSFVIVPRIEFLSPSNCNLNSFELARVLRTSLQALEFYSGALRLKINSFYSTASGLCKQEGNKDLLNVCNLMMVKVPESTTQYQFAGFHILKEDSGNLNDISLVQDTMSCRFAFSCIFPANSKTLKTFSRVYPYVSNNYFSDITPSNAMISLKPLNSQMLEIIDDVTNPVQITNSKFISHLCDVLNSSISPDEGNGCIVSSQVLKNIAIALMKHLKATERKQAAYIIPALMVVASKINSDVLTYNIIAINSLKDEDDNEKNITKKEMLEEIKEMKKLLIEIMELCQILAADEMTSLLHSMEINGSCNFPDSSFSGKLSYPSPEVINAVCSSFSNNNDSSEIGPHITTSRSLRFYETRLPITIALITNMATDFDADFATIGTNEEILSQFVKSNSPLTFLINDNYNDIFKDEKKLDAQIVERSLMINILTIQFAVRIIRAFESLSFAFANKCGQNIQSNQEGKSTTTSSVLGAIGISALQIPLLSMLSSGQDNSFIDTERQNSTSPLAAVYSMPELLTATMKTKEYFGKIVKTIYKSIICNEPIYRTYLEAKFINCVTMISGDLIQQFADDKCSMIASNTYFLLRVLIMIYKRSNDDRKNETIIDTEDIATPKSGILESAGDITMNAVTSVAHTAANVLSKVRGFVGSPKDPIMSKVKGAIDLTSNFETSLRGFVNKQSGTFQNGYLNPKFVFSEVSDSFLKQIVSTLSNGTSEFPQALSFVEECLPSMYVEYVEEYDPVNCISQRKEQYVFDFSSINFKRSHMEIFLQALHTVAGQKAGIMSKDTITRNNTRDFIWKLYLYGDQFIREEIEEEEKNQRKKEESLFNSMEINKVNSVSSNEAIASKQIKKVNNDNIKSNIINTYDNINDTVEKNLNFAPPIRQEQQEDYVNPWDNITTQTNTNPWSEQIEENKTREIWNEPEKPKEKLPWEISTQPAQNEMSNTPNNNLIGDGQITFTYDENEDLRNRQLYDVPVLSMEPRASTNLGELMVKAGKETKSDISSYDITNLYNITEQNSKTIYKEPYLYQNENSEKITEPYTQSVTIKPFEENISSKYIQDVKQTENNGFSIEEDDDDDDIEFSFNSSKNSKSKKEIDSEDEEDYDFSSPIKSVSSNSSKKKKE